MILNKIIEAKRAEANGEEEKKYYIAPKTSVVDEITAFSSENAIQDFAWCMCSDMNEYFTATDELLTKTETTDSGSLYSLNAMLPTSVFRISLEIKKEYDDGTCDWDLILALRKDKKKKILLGTFHGTEEEAKAAVIWMLYAKE